jgi:hypothetical protein
VPDTYIRLTVSQLVVRLGTFVSQRFSGEKFHEEPLKCPLKFLLLADGLGHLASHHVRFIYYLSTIRKVLHI